MPQLPLWSQQSIHFYFSLSLFVSAWWQSLEYSLPWEICWFLVKSWASFPMMIRISKSWMLPPKVVLQTCSSLNCRPCTCLFFACTSGGPSLYGWAAALAVHTPKLVVAIWWRPTDDQWNTGSFWPLSTSAVVTNLAMMILHLFCWVQQLSTTTRVHRASEFVLMVEGLLLVEAVVLCYWCTRNAPAAVVIPTKHSFLFWSFSFCFCLMTIPRVLIG